MSADWRGRLFATGFALAGLATFLLMDLPLPFLFGPMVGCLLAALMGFELKGYGQISVAARTILGVAVGTSVTPAVLAQIPQMAGSVALIPIYIAVIGLIGVPFFRRVCGYDLPTAYYASMPGGLQDMILFGQEAGADPRVLSLIHATRVLIIVTIAPILLTSVYGRGLTNPMGTSLVQLAPVEVMLMIVAAWVGWKGGERIGLFGASILGPMIVSGAFSLGDLVHARPPSEAILAAQFFIGVGVGVHYVGVTAAELRKTISAGVAFVLILAVLAAFFAQVASRLGLAPALEAFLAFAPGGQAEMMVLAIVVGADLGFVVTHHLVRIILVIIGAPIVAKVVTRKRAEP